MKFNAPTLVTITGPTCSGKSYLAERLIENRFTRIVSTTTRPPRTGERQGVDYDFISHEQSIQLEQDGLFAELIEFNGIRYGVTEQEMLKKLSSSAPPVIVLEPQGVTAYERYCYKHKWEIFKIFVQVRQPLLIERLNERTYKEIQLNCEADATARAIKAHSARLISIVGPERNWCNVDMWDVIVPGDDIDYALGAIKREIEYRNTFIKI